MAKKDERASINMIINAVEARDVLLRKSQILSKGSPSRTSMNVGKIRLQDSKRKSTG